MGDYNEIDLSDREFQILQSEMKSHNRSVGIAYLLLIFFGAIGGHQFYLGRWVWGIIYFILTVSSIITTFLSLFILGCFLIYDLATMSKQIEKVRNEKKKEVISKIKNESMRKMLDDPIEENEFR